jgi:hypothetical protein
MKYEHFESDLKLNEEFIPLSMQEPLDKDRSAWRVVAGHRHRQQGIAIWSPPSRATSPSLYQPCRKRVRSAKHTLLKSLPGLTYIETGNVITKNEMLLN